jgi:hypothetical protein
MVGVGEMDGVAVGVGMDGTYNACPILSASVVKQLAVWSSLGLIFTRTLIEERVSLTCTV